MKRIINSTFLKKNTYIVTCINKSSIIKVHEKSITFKSNVCLNVSNN